jgi:hypothetical protein
MIRMQIPRLSPRRAARICDSIHPRQRHERILAIHVRPRITATLLAQQPVSTNRVTPNASRVARHDVTKSGSKAPIRSSPLDTLETNLEVF